MFGFPSPPNRKRQASPGLVGPPAQRHQNSASGSRLPHATLPVSAAEQKERIGAFSHSVEQNMITRLNQSYIDDIVDLSAANPSDADLWEGLSFIHDIWSEQISLARHVAGTVEYEMAEKSPSSAPWYRRWLERNCPAAPQVVQASRARPSFMPVARTTEQPVAAPAGHLRQVETMAAKLRCCLEVTVIQYFHTQMFMLKRSGKILDTSEVEDKNADEQAVPCFVRRWNAISLLVDEFHQRCIQSPQDIRIDRLHDWLGKQQHIRLRCLRFLMAQHAPTEGILFITEEPIENDDRSAGSNRCYCTDGENELGVRTSYSSRKPKHPCRSSCTCIYLALACTPERCHCADDCGNPFNSIERIFGPAEPPVAPSACFKYWLTERHPLKKPLEATELFDLVYPQLGRFPVADSLLDRWKDAWTTLKDRPKNNPDRQAHVQLLLRIAAARDMPGRTCTFSFCVRGSTGWYKIGREVEGHCARCNECQPGGTWHCSICHGCFQNSRETPCIQCGGVSRDYLRIVRRRRKSGDGTSSDSGSE